ncbi:MAG: hypothetical protein K0S40_3781 [Actinomycetospora sp.]|nr:hypothetical protein [Actinomycetospora sp.]
MHLVVPARVDQVLLITGVGSDLASLPQRDVAAIVALPRTTSPSTSGR